MSEPNYKLLSEELVNTLSELRNYIDSYDNLDFVASKVDAVLEHYDDQVNPKVRMDLVYAGKAELVSYNQITYCRVFHEDATISVKWYKKQDEILYPVIEREIIETLNKSYTDSIESVFEESSEPSLNIFENKKTLYDVVYEWWSEVFENGNSKGYNVSSLVDDIEEWLPEEQSLSRSFKVSTKYLIKGFNQCIEKIRMKLR